MTIKSINAPAISREGINRLFAFTKAKRMTSDMTLFDAGYEQAKRDMLEKLAGEVGWPNDSIVTADHAADRNRVELPQAGKPKPRWFR